MKQMQSIMLLSFIILINAYYIGAKDFLTLAGLVVSATGFIYYARKD